MDCYWRPLDCVFCHRVSPTEMIQENLLKNNVFVFQVSFVNCSYINENIVSWIITRSKYLLYNWVFQMNVALVLCALPSACLHDSLLKTAVYWIADWCFHPRHVCSHHDMWVLPVKCVSFHPLSGIPRPCSLPPVWPLIQVLMVSHTPFHHRPFPKYCHPAQTFEHQCVLL